MNRRLLLVASLASALAIQGAWSAYSQTAAFAEATAAKPPFAQATAKARPPAPLRSQRVQGDLHMISGDGGNVAVYVTAEGVVLVDDMFDRNHADILAQVKQITDQPIRYVINTHQHDDHAGGSFKMLPLTEVIAHRNVYANLKDLKRPYFEDTPGTPIGLPRVTFSERLDLHLGGKDVEAHYFGRGHTSGDIIVYFPELKAIHTGDLYLSGSRAGVPIYVDAVQGGSLLEWTRTLERTLQLDFDTVIPGHGPVATKADVARFNASIGGMRARLQSMIKGGAGKEAVVQVIEKEYGWRATGCPPAPQMTPGCLQYQQIDALIAELR